jgi:hypothetical protein
MQVETSLSAHSGPRLPAVAWGAVLTIKEATVPNPRIFLSYASADATFAEAVGGRLKDVFFGVELIWDERIPRGLNYLTLIDQALDDADLLLMIRTGREKLDQSYSAYEIGYFRKSLSVRKERSMIIFNIFTGMPVPANQVHQVIASDAEKIEYNLAAMGKTLI